MTTTNVSSGQTSGGLTISSSSSDDVLGYGVASGTTLLGGTEKVFYTGVSDSATISSSGIEIVSNVGVATAATVSSSGSLDLLSGGLASDGITFGGTDAALLPITWIGSPRICLRSRHALVASC